MWLEACSSDKYYNKGLTEQYTLENMLALQRPYVSQMALSLLKRDNPEYLYNEVIIEPEGLLYESAPPEEKIEPGSVTEENILTIYPNPGYTHITVKYKTSEMRYTILWMKMHDSNGKVVLTKLLKGGDNEELIGLGELRPGSYTVILYADEEMISTEKLNVIK